MFEDKEQRAILMMDNQGAINLPKSYNNNKRKVCPKGIWQKMLNNIFVNIIIYYLNNISYTGTEPKYCTIY